MVPADMWPEGFEPEILQGNKRWEDWCDTFLAAATVAMTDQQCETFIKLSLIETLGKDEAVDKMQAEFSKTNQYEVLKQHGDSISLDINLFASLMIGTVSRGPGDLVMYVHALRRAQRKYGPITLGVIADYLFPLGFVAPDELDRLWGLQKDKTFPLGNFLDGVQG